jgi:hypothetical protein
MAEYIERTEELMLAMNAGARAIENTKRYHGAVYTRDVFSESPQEIPYLQAAKVLREVSDAPTADVAPVVRCKDCIYTRKLYGRLVCKYGTCSGCILREDFFCANGERRASDGE